MTCYSLLYEMFAKSAILATCVHIQAWKWIECEHNSVTPSYIIEAFGLLCFYYMPT